MPSYTTAPNNIANNGVLFANSALFGVITQTSVNPRLIQFGLYYRF